MNSYIEKNGVKVRFVEIDQVKAREYLASSTGNRKINAKRVDQFRSMMNENKWTPISTIVVGADGHLKDGHHRMIAQSDSTVKNVFIEISGIEESWVSKIDTGRSRSAADFCCFVSELSDVTDIAKCSSVAKFVICINEMKTTNCFIEYERISNFIFDEKDPLLNSIAICKELKRATRIGTNTGFISAVYKIVKRANVGCRQFFDSLCDGAGLSKGSPILALRNYMFAKKYSGCSQALLDDYFNVCKAWNAYVNGNEIRLIKSNGSSRASIKDVRECRFM